MGAAEGGYGSGEEKRACGECGKGDEVARG